MKPTRTERELVDGLRALFPKAEYALLPQVGNATGYGGNRHADAIAMSLWPSRGLGIHGFECKSSRSDWTRELRDPAKAEAIARFCNHWWIVAGNGDIVADGELPEGWGLLVWDHEKNALRRVKSAPRRDAQLPTTEFIAAALRVAQDCVGPDAELEAARKAGFEAGHAAGHLAGEQSVSYEVSALRELRKRVDAFEAASGVSICGGWHSGEKIGTAVRLVLEGGVLEERDRLIAICEHTITKLRAAEAPARRRAGGAA